ncbi:MAG TPA: type II secretion system F family protein [Dehalococcoidia bacterium]|nr:type II secretion system F family protein [Dehalococcoidia bacterium]
MVEGLAALFAFVTVALFGLALLSARRGDRLLTERIRALREQEERLQQQEARLRRPATTLPVLRDLLRGGWVEKTSRTLQQADVKLRPGEYLMMRLLAGGLLFVIPVVFTGGSAVGMLVGVPLAVAGYVAPALWVALRRRRRLNAIERQLPELLSLLSSSLRSGFGLQQGMDVAARQMEPPMRDEIEGFLLDTNLGASAEAALVNMVERAGSYDLDMVVTAILIQRMTGGNLAEVLDNVGETMRERERIRGEIRTLTAQQRLTGTILSVYPAVLAGLFYLINPKWMSVLFTDGLGQVLLAIGLFLQFLGFLTIRRILDIPI